jgi:hypothetical protein
MHRRLLPSSGLLLAAIVAAPFAVLAACGGSEEAATGASGAGGASSTAASGGTGGSLVTSTTSTGGSGASAELCGNGLDDDGDGLVDEGCTCEVGKTQPCFGGDPKRAGKGACTLGSQTCNKQSGEIEQGSWGACTGYGDPSPEVCDGAADEDCDGSVDNGCPSTSGDEKACSNACGQGKQTCVEGKWGGCSAPSPEPEVCDGKDDDCNGAADDGLEQACSGPCGPGTQTCSAGQWGACTPAQACGGGGAGAGGAGGGGQGCSCRTGEWADAGCVCRPLAYLRASEGLQSPSFACPAGYAQDGRWTVGEVDNYAVSFSHGVDGVNPSPSVVKGWMWMCTHDASLVRTILDSSDCGDAVQACPPGTQKSGRWHTGIFTTCGTGAPKTEFGGAQASEVGTQAGWMAFCVSPAVGVRGDLVEDDCAVPGQITKLPGCTTWSELGSMHGEPDAWNDCANGTVTLVGPAGTKLVSGWLGLCVDAKTPWP